jgi:hypothetical protein
MKPTNDIRELFQKAAVTTRPETDPTVLSKILAAQETTRTDGSTLNRSRLRSKIMHSRITKLAIAAVVVTGALTVGVERLARTKPDQTDAFSAEIRANMALDLDPQAAIPLRRAQPEDFDVTWDGENGGTLRIMPGPSLRLLANSWRNAEWKDILWWAHSQLEKVRESTSTSVPARDARFVAILTSEGNLAVAEIGSHDESRARLRWQVKRMSVPVYGPARTVTLGWVDPNEATLQPCAIDFDTGQTLGIPTQMLRMAPERFLVWLEQNGVDAIASVTEGGVGLTGVGLVYSEYSPGGWASKSAVELRDDMILVSHQSRDPILFRLDRHQLVYPFKTREGGLGMLQMRGIDPDERTVQLRYRMAHEPIADAEPVVPKQDPESLGLARSQERLQRLGRLVMLYANDNEYRLPRSIEEIHAYAEDEAHYRAILEHVGYVGTGHSLAEPPMVVVAYDKTLLVEGKGTYVLFLDSHVEFVEPEKLTALGVRSAR